MSVHSLFNCSFRVFNSDNSFSAFSTSCSNSTHSASKDFAISLLSAISFCDNLMAFSKSSYFFFSLSSSAFAFSNSAFFSSSFRSDARHSCSSCFTSPSTSEFSLSNVLIASSSSLQTCSNSASLVLAVSNSLRATTTFCLAASVSTSSFFCSFSNAKVSALIFSTSRSSPTQFCKSDFSSP